MTKYLLSSGFWLIVIWATAGILSYATGGGLWWWPVAATAIVFVIEFVQQNRRVIPIRWRLWRTRRYSPPYERPRD